MDINYVVYKTFYNFFYKLLCKLYSIRNIELFIKLELVKIEYIK